jgi:capsular polysaccharide transport system permease protein
MGDEATSKPGLVLAATDAEAKARPQLVRERAALGPALRARAEARRFARVNRLPAAQPVEPLPEIPDPAEQSKVIQIVRRLQEATDLKRSRGRNWTLISAAICILVPTFLAAIYFVFIAADRYVSEARFAVRSNQAQAADVLGMMTGMTSSTVVSDSYIVADYVRSSEMIKELERRLPLREIYADPRADFLTRLDPQTSQEELVEYWNDRVDVFYDSTKNTIAIEVQAFTAENAERVAAAIVDIVRGLVNELSAQSRRDAVQFAAAEVARAELRVRGARDDMLKFRSEHHEFDPALTATATLGRVAQLETERSQLNSQLAAISGYLASDAPSVQMLQSRIGALTEEIDRIQSEMASTTEGGQGESAEVAPNALASVVAKYQEVLLSQEFAEKAYTAALGSLERARTEADRAQSYLAIYMHPDVADEAAYPERLLDILMVLALAAVLWAVGSLGVLTIRDHMH